MMENLILSEYCPLHLEAAYTAECVVAKMIIWTQHQDREAATRLSRWTNHHR